MLVVYRKENLQIEHLISISSESALSAIASDPQRGLLEIEGDLMPHQIGLAEVGGEIVAFAKKEFDIEGSQTGSTVGSVATFKRVPVGTMIDADGTVFIMDHTKNFSLTFESPGTYHLTFTHPEYVPAQMSFEISA